MTSTIPEPPDGTILADTDLTEAWVRDDEGAAYGGWANRNWYRMGYVGGIPKEWSDVPEDVKLGVRLIVAEES
ncbi:MAG TPA: hypothetical protein VL652_34915 [Kutzneria sp.]|jgi:hypothetical protein|nr:hypothetical protein [Kutzneria sp.]